MSKDALAALGVINRSASEVSANRNANHARRGKAVVRAPANQRQLVAQLHHGGPDVVEELNFDYRLQSASGHAGGAAHDVRFRDAAN